MPHDHHSPPPPESAESAGKSCCHKPEPEPTEESCCHGEGHHSAAQTEEAAAERHPAAKYFCPMCAGVESNEPGSCPKCGMALERNPMWKAAAKTLYTCPMHPE